MLRFSLQLPLVFPRKRFDDLLRKSHVLRRLKPAATVRHYYHDEYDVDMFQYDCDDKNFIVFDCTTFFKTLYNLQLPPPSILLSFIAVLIQL
ncbi:MAG: hypothetical protein ACUZ8N_09400 [Candidatus Scalindua sp.]